MEPGEDRLKDIYDKFCQGTHTDPIERPKAAIFLLAAFGIGFADANIPQWWHRLLPPNTRCILGQEGHEDVAQPPTAPRTGRGRGRADADHNSFWDSVPRQIVDVFHPQPAATAPVSIEACVSVLQALPRSETRQLDRMELQVREAALARLVPLLQMPLPNRNQRPRVRSPSPHDLASAAARDAAARDDE